MKPTFKDYLSIALALLAIFLCGYGIGFLFGERKGQANLPAPAVAPAPARPITDWNSWESSTLARIEEAVKDLTPEQREKIRVEITETAQRIRTARSEMVKSNVVKRVGTGTSSTGRQAATWGLVG